MPPRYVAALDQGTTSSRAVLVDESGRIVRSAQRELRQHYPQPGWVEHDPDEIRASQEAVLHQVLREASVAPAQVVAIGIANQRETTVVWDRRTGRPIHRAIVWQDRRTAPECERLKTAGLEPLFRERTGLVLDPYFSGTKLAWILSHVEGARERARRGELCFGTVDAWLVWHLTGGRVHATDPSNASRTLLFDIRRRTWDRELLEALDIPDAVLPEVRDSAGPFGTFACDGADIPVLGVAGDQQAALFGQACFEPGQAKNTYGTGCFLLLNTGEKPVASRHGLLSTVAWQIGGRATYALEGSVLVAGAAIQWLRDGLGILASSAESERLAREAGKADEVYVVPAFAGLGTPHWDPYARGAIFGLTRGTTRAHLVKATLESLAFQTRDVLRAMQADTGIALTSLRVDGGAAANDFLMQFQADILGTPVERPREIESTAIGAAGLAGLAAGFWDRERFRAARAAGRTFAPAMDEAARAARCGRWQRAVERTKGWLDAG
jgi:glycerol kinase